MPSLADKDLWRQLPLSEPGTYHLSLGEVTVTAGDKLHVRHPVPSPGAATHLERSLYDHLGTSGEVRFSCLSGDASPIAIWAAEAGRYSLSVLRLLGLIIDRIRGQGLRVIDDDSDQPGLTKWFAITAWHDLLGAAHGHSWINDSWYRIPETAADQWSLKCGAFDIARAAADTLAKSLALHKSLRSDRGLLGEAVGMERHRATLEAEAIRLSGILEEFSDLDSVPGHCLLCSAPHSPGA